MTMAFWRSITSESKSKIIEKAEERLEEIRGVIARRIVEELTSDTYYRFHRAFSPCMQEYVEARLLLSYCTDGTLIGPGTIDTELQKSCTGSKLQFSLDVTDYVLGVADLTGELMRKAVSVNGPAGIRLHDDLCDIKRAMDTLSESHAVGKGMLTKLQVLHQSVGKVQKRCYKDAIQKAEVLRLNSGSSDIFQKHSDTLSEPARKKSKPATETTELKDPSVCM